MLQSLGLLLGKELEENTELKQPDVPDISRNIEITRPEIKLYADQTAVLENQYKMIDAGNTPKTSVFFQGGYGRPGYNFLRNNFDWYYMTGIRLRWQLGGFYTSKKERQLVELNKKMVDAQKETFLLNTNTQLRQEQSEIEKFSQLIATDDSIIVIRTRVREASKAQLENAVITSNDYIREVNEEDQARLTRITHHLQLLQARINYQTILGKQ
jgi:outer membrane protein TolC